MQAAGLIRHTTSVVALLSWVCCLGIFTAHADVIGSAKIAPEYESFRVRRIKVYIKGSAEDPKLTIPESVMFPLDVILEIRRKTYELLKDKDIPKGHPPAGTLSILYEVTRKAKGGGKQALFEVKLAGQISLRAKQANTLLWGVKVEATETVTNSEKLPADVIETLVKGFYKDAFKTLPPAPKYKMVVGAPYRFRERITREPLRLPQDKVSVGRIMRGIAAGRWEGAPRPIHDISPGGGAPVVQIWNDSEEQLTVCYNGVTPVDLILAPGATLAFRLAPGHYDVGARTADPDIVPFYNSETMQPHKVYSIRFAVSEEGY
ncbi:MAG: hypothetical protein GXP25_13645 [Planctomycetes bacterium]|nr:hypothetical protein [Planctomycetota bacterium]